MRNTQPYLRERKPKSSEGPYKCNEFSRKCNTPG